MREKLYKGFSTFEFQKNKTFALYDVESVKMDLLNHIFTRKGERLNMPEFGTLIPELVFEPLTDDMVEELQEELEAVFEYDPRVEMVNLVINPLYDQNRVEVQVTLYYIELNITDEINLNLDFG